MSALDKRKWLLSEVGWQTSSIKPPPPSQTGLHHLSQCCLGCLDQGLSYPVQLSYTVPPFKILERYWLVGRLRRPSSSDLGMHLLSNLGRSLLAMATKRTKLTPTGVRHWPASTLASPTAHREHRQIYLRVNSLLAMATKSTKLTPTGVRHWPASTLASPTAHREHRQIYLRVICPNSTKGI